MKAIFLLLFLALSASMVHGQAKKKFSKPDSLKLNYCNCDSLYKNFPAKPPSKVNAPEFDGNGWNKLYNFQNQIGQCGYFEKSYFLFGLRYIYDMDGKLTRIDKYFNGRKVGTCDIGKK